MCHAANFACCCRSMGGHVVIDYIYYLPFYCVLLPLFSVKESLLGRQPSVKALAMTTENLIEWLSTIKLSKYAKIFEEEKMNGELLATCDVEALKELGIRNGLDCRKIILQFRKIE